jgi:hypothetical protein
MTIRNGMYNLVNRLRQMGDAAESEYTLGNETFWTSDHLQTVLDQHRQDVYREPLKVAAVYNNGGSAIYQDYYFDCANAEEAASGSAAWEVENSLGSAIGTADYTVNYEARHIRFTADTAGTAYYLTYRTYDLERAAAIVWERKAASVASRAWDASTDNHSLSRQQIIQNYQNMARYYRSQAKPRMHILERSDT